MKFNVKNTITGEIISIEADPSTTGAELRNMLRNLTKIPTKDQCLDFKGIYITVEETLGERGIVENSVAELTNLHCLIAFDPNQASLKANAQYFA